MNLISPKSSESPGGQKVTPGIISFQSRIVAKVMSRLIAATHIINSQGMVDIPTRLLDKRNLSFDYSNIFRRILTRNSPPSEKVHLRTVVYKS
jgi:hypothetical protein